MSRVPRGPWVCWRPAAALDDMMDLTAMEELAYRRILDMVFKSDDTLRDDDRVMPHATKAGRQWKAIKAALIAKGKITVEGGCIRNAKATATCIETRTYVAQKRTAAGASHAPGKRLKKHETTPAAADAAAHAGAGASAHANKQSLRDSLTLTGKGAKAPRKPAAASVPRQADMLGAKVVPMPADPVREGKERIHAFIQAHQPRISRGRVFELTNSVLRQHCDGAPAPTLATIEAVEVLLARWLARRNAGQVSEDLETYLRGVVADMKEHAAEAAATPPSRFAANAPSRYGLEAAASFGLPEMQRAAAGGGGLFARASGPTLDGTAEEIR